MKKALLFLSLLISSKSFSYGNEKDFFLREFEEQIQKNGLTIDMIDEHRVIHINKNGIIVKVSLDNLRKNYQRDTAPELISDFVKSLIKIPIDAHKKWEQVKDHIFISFVPNDFDLKDFVYEKVTNDFNKIYVLTDHEQLILITKQDLEDWKITQAELNIQSNQNADALLKDTSIEYILIEKRKIGLIKSNNTMLKGALLFAPLMKSKIENEIGFPFYAILPVQDFCYIFSEKDFEFFSSRLGSVVVNEYKKSGHPISTEILKFTDNGTEAVGKFPIK